MKLFVETDLDREGFLVAEAPSDFHAFASRDAIIDGYCPEAERIVTRLAGAARCLAFDFTVRHNARMPNRRPQLELIAPHHLVERMAGVMVDAGVDVWFG